MGTDLRGLDTVLGPIRAHPRNPWLIQALRSISTCHLSTILEVLSFHDVTVVIPSIHIEMWKNLAIPTSTGPTATPVLAMERLCHRKRGRTGIVALPCICSVNAIQ